MQTKLSKHKSNSNSNKCRAEMLKKIITCYTYTLIIGVVISSSSPADAITRNEKKFWDHTRQVYVNDKPEYYHRTIEQKFSRRNVRIKTKEKKGTIIVDTETKFLYLITGRNRAIRYGVGVGRKGFEWQGVVNLARKAEWPAWTPPPRMVERVWEQQKRKIGFMKGGPKNPLGARALYLYDKHGSDTGYRIHGTNQPWSIGLNMSSGCIRMLNKDVEHLFEKAKVGAKVIVIGPGNKHNRDKYYKPNNNLFSVSAVDQDR